MRLDPALSLEWHPELVTDLLGRPLGSALNRTLACHLAAHFHRPTDEKADGVAAREGDCSRDSCTRCFVTPGLDFAGAESAQPLLRHQVAFDRRPQMGRPGAEPQHDALGRAARVDGFEIAHEHEITDPRRRLARRPYGWQTHAPDLRDQLLRDFSAQLAAKLDLLRCLWRAMFRILTRDSGPGRDVGRGRCKVMHDDAIRTRDLATRIRLA